MPITRPVSLAVIHCETERVLREVAVPNTVLRNGHNIVGYADHLGEYLAAGEITGAVGHGRMFPQDQLRVSSIARSGDECGACQFVCQHIARIANKDRPVARFGVADREATFGRMSAGSDHRIMCIHPGSTSSAPESSIACRPRGWDRMTVGLKAHLHVATGCVGVGAHLVGRGHNRNGALGVANSWK